MPSVGLVADIFVVPSIVLECCKDVWTIAELNALLLSQPWGWR